MMQQRLVPILLLVLLLGPAVSMAGPPGLTHQGDISLPAEAVAVRARPGSGELWVSLQDGSLVVVDAKQHRVLGRVADVGSSAWGLAFHPDGSRVYGTSWMANELVVVDADRRVIQRKINVGLKPAFVSVAPAGDRLWVSNFFSGELSQIDLTKDLNLGDVDVGRRPMGLAVDYGRKVAYVGSGAAGVLTTFDLESGEVTGTRDVQFASTHNLAISRDGSRLVAAGRPDSLLVFDPRTSTSKVTKIPVGRDPVGATMGPAGRYVFVTNYQDSTISTVDLEMGQQVAVTPTAEAPMFLTLDEAARTLYVCGSRSKSLSVYSVGDPRWGLHPVAAASGAEGASAP